MDQEADIIKGLKAGSDEAYRYLYDHHYKSLCSVAFMYVKDMVVAEMVVSDVISSLWFHRESLNIKTTLRIYLVKSVRNRSLNYLAEADRQHALRQYMGKKMETEQADDNANPLIQLIEKELDQKINNAIDALPEQTRKIFCMSRFNDMKYDEIARETDVSVDVVKYHIKSALARLRVSLKNDLP